VKNLDNRQLIRKYYDMWNHFDFDHADQWLHAKIHFRGSLDITAEGIEEFKEYAHMLTTAFENLHHSIEIEVYENNLAAAYVTYSAKHVGELLGYAPTGKHINYSGAVFFQIRNSKIVSINVLGDLNALHKQLTAS
jgi:predicted ester cyclase